jgi:hypothetical protein
MWLSSRWAWGRIGVSLRSPRVTNSIPSRPKTSREPKCLVPSYVGCARKITLTCSSRLRSAESTPRATLVALPSSLGSE